MTRFATQRATVAEIRHETFDGRDHLVAPVVAIREMVLDSGFLPAAEIGRFVEAWNGIPLVMDHPTERGVPVSANRPEILERRGVGRLWNARLEDGRLLGELWIDMEKARRLGGEALEALARLERGQPLEVSTGYFTDEEAVEGSFRGRRYEKVQRNLRPDHLALLPNAVGACSWADGCGAPRVNHEGGGGGPAKDTVGRTVRAAVGGIARALGLSPGAGGEPAAAGRRVGLEKYPARMEASMRHNQSGPGGSLGEFLRARRDELGLSNEALAQVSGLDLATIEGVLSGELVRPGDEVLRALADALGLALDDVLSRVETDGGGSGMEAQRVARRAGAPRGNQAQPCAAGRLPGGLDEFLQTIAVPEYRLAIARALDAERERRASLAAALAANARCRLSHAELGGLSTEVLQKLSDTLAPEDYSGRGGPRAGFAGDDTIPPAPSVVLARGEARGR